MGRRTVVLALVGLLATACGQGGNASATPMPLATSADEFAAAWCSSLEAMVRAIGNPDTGTDSELSAALDEAIERGDAAGVERVAASMLAELESGRRLAAVAAGWEPGSEAATQVDRLIHAFEAMVEAKRAGAEEGSAAADALGQAALEQAGGLAAWTGMIESARSVPVEALQHMDCPVWEAGTPK